MNQSQKDKLLALEPEFINYVKKTRGYSSASSYISTVILFEEFKEWKRDNRTISKG